MVGGRHHPRGALRPYWGTLDMNAMAIITRRYALSAGTASRWGGDELAPAARRAARRSGEGEERHTASTPSDSPAGATPAGDGDPRRTRV
jgi:hypothetical protein